MSNNNNVVKLTDSNVVKEMNKLETGTSAVINGDSTTLTTATGSLSFSGYVGQAVGGSTNVATSGYGYWNGYSWVYPWNTYTYSYPVYGFVTVDKAENGFIITKNGKKYVAKKAEEIVKYLKDEEK